MLFLSPRIALLLAVITAALPVLAQQTENPVPVLKMEKGAPYTATWPDGREAVLKVTHLDSPLVSMNIKITDNTCTNRQGMSCRYNLKFRNYWLAMVWAKNPDASKIGQIVEYASYTSETEPQSFSKLEVTEALTAGLDQSHLKKIAAGLPAHEIQCDDFSWLPGGAKEPPANLHVSRWDGEDNIKNPETGISENRVAGGTYGVTLAKTGVSSMKIADIKAVTGAIDSFDIMMLFPITSMTMSNADGDICQTAINSNIQADLLGAYNTLMAQRPATDERAPYIVGSDEILDHSSVKLEIKFWFMQPQYRVYR